MSVILYIAQSIDGYIARPDGDISWLKPFDGVDYGYKEFLAGIDVLVMGATTYRQVLSFGPWPYEGKSVIIFSHHPIPERDVATDATRIVKKFSKKRIWLVGGSEVIDQFLEKDLIDEFRIFVMPLALGKGIPLFQRAHTLQLTAAKTYPNGVVELSYTKQLRKRKT